MRASRFVGLIVAVLLVATAVPSFAVPPQRSAPLTQKPVIDGRLEAPDSPNPYLAFLPAGQIPDYANWNAFLNAAGKVRASQEAPGAARRGVRVDEQEEPGAGTNDVQADAEFISKFGTSPGKRPAAEINGTAPEGGGGQLAILIEELDGSLGTATVVPLGVGDTATGSGVIGDEAAPDGPPDFDFFKIPGVSAGETIVVDTDTPDPFGDLDSFVAIWNPAISPFAIAVNDDGDGSSFDSFLTFTAPVDGDYFVSVGGFGAFLPDDPTDPASPSVTGDLGSEGVYDLTLQLVSLDTDFYSFDAVAGDIIGVSVDGAAVRVELYDESGTLLIGSSQDITFIHPQVSPLPGGGNAAASYVVEADGTYAISVQAAGMYSADLRAFRPAKELLGNTTQTLFIDFDGETVDPGVLFGPPGEVALTPLAGFLSGWGLTAADEDAVIDAILAVIEENLSEDMRAMGNNGDRDAGDGRGSFDVEILNSRDHADPWGDQNVSRVIVGGTIPELGIFTIGIAQSIDVGDFESEESAVVLLDVLSANPGDPFYIPGVSLNDFTIDPSSSIIELIGVGVGNIVAHEAGHFSANWHTNQFNPSANIMDQGGNLPGTIGVGPDGIFGSADDVDVDFGEDVYVGNEGFTGLEDTLQSISFGYSTGHGPG